MAWIPSVLSSINSCSYIIWYGSRSLAASINSCFVHHLVWILPSTVALCIWNDILHLPCPSTVVLYIIWYGKSLIGLIHQQLFRTSSGIDAFICLVHQQFFCTSSDMESPFLVWSINSCFLHHLAWNPSVLSSINICLYMIWYG